MIEPVELQNFFITFFSAAMVVIMGALYALIFAWSLFHRRPKLIPFAYAAYAGLFISVLTLAECIRCHRSTFPCSLIVAANSQLLSEIIIDA